MEYKGSYDVTLVINNVCASALEFPYWVVRPVDGELWYYGAWNEESTAKRVASEIEGIVVRRT